MEIPIKIHDLGGFPPIFGLTPTCISSDDVLDVPPLKNTPFIPPFWYDWMPSSQKSRGDPWTRELPRLRAIPSSWLSIWMFPKIGVGPQIIHLFIGFSIIKPSILGYHYSIFLETSISGG